MSVTNTTIEIRVIRRDHDQLRVTASVASPGEVERRIEELLDWVTDADGNEGSFLFWCPAPREDYRVVVMIDGLEHEEDELECVDCGADLDGRPGWLAKGGELSCPSCRSAAEVAA